MDPQTQAALVGGLSGGIVGVVGVLVTTVLTNRHQAKLQVLQLKQQTVLAIVSYEYERLRRVEAEMTLAAHLLDARNVDKELAAEAILRLRGETGYLHHFPRLHECFSQFLDAFLGVPTQGATDQHRRAVQDQFNAFRSELTRLVESGEIAAPLGETNLFGFRS